MQPTAPPARRAPAVVLVAALAAAVLAGDPAAAALPGPARAPGPPPVQAPEPDVPLPTNPISPRLDDVGLASDELDSRRGVLDEARDRRDAAVRHRNELRQRLVDIAAERAATVTALEQRRAEEAQRGEERAAAVRAHRQRAAEAKEAGLRLGRAQDRLRGLLVDSYMSGSTAVADELAALSGTGGINDSLVRLTLGESTVAGRARDVEQLTVARDDALAARGRALEARRRAEQAERDAIAARRATEQHIADLDAEARRTVEDEAVAAADVQRREGEVLVALDRLGPARLRADVVGLDFQLVALDAWVKAADTAPCRLEWWALAGISKVEGRHGTYGGGTLTARGRPTRAIIGPRLDGGPFAVVGDSDGGAWDGDAAYDRAVGPMQFIPSTWRAWSRDGDGDGTADPQSFYDATAAAAAYLCAGRSDLTDEAQLRAGYFSYNHSGAYVEAVLAEARRYQAALTVPAVPPAPAGG
ncbi:MAG TPA: lytic murein transglycosylase [Acidimicrobiales bacterium]|nr:lytic murein transglycosylase [Acidimicrobiales bacterium]